MKVFGFAGWSGSGKTTLVEKLIPRFTARGLRVSVIKHAHHGFDLDKPGKDSWRHREAGAPQVLMLSERPLGADARAARRAGAHAGRTAAPARTLRPGADRGLQGRDRSPRSRSTAPSHGKPPLWPENPHVVAVATERRID
jgi:molybdopterin-guanine dinucleotide biosynthesis protein B